MRFRWILLGILFSVSCNPSKFPDYYQLGELRILAMPASSPDAYPGETVTISPWVSYLNGSNISFVATACSDPGVSLGVDPSCENQADKVSLGQGVLTAPTASTSFTGSMAPLLTVTIPTDYLEGRSPWEKSNGRAYLVTLELSADGSKKVFGFRRIVVKSPGQVKNLNPSIADLLADSSSLSVLPIGQTVSLRPVMGFGAETYSVLNQDFSTTTLVESLLTTWFVSDGKLKYQRTSNEEVNEYVGPEVSVTGRASYFIIVVRDGRGGESVILRSF
jgi:hypothetical protein